MDTTSAPQVSFTFTDYDLIINALRFSEDTYSALASATSDNSYSILSEDLFELRIKIELSLEDCAPSPLNGGNASE